MYNVYPKGVHLMKCIYIKKQNTIILTKQIKYCQKFHEIVNF